MDPEFSPQRTSGTDEDAIKNEWLKKGSFVIVFIFLIGTFIGHIITIALGIPMLRHCYTVALVVMIIGSILGLLQQVPEFFRNFIKLRPDSTSYVNYFFGLIVLLRVIWLITATVVIVNAECENIVSAWICISVNWGVLGFFVIFSSAVMIVRCLKKRRQS